MWSIVTRHRAYLNGCVLSISDADRSRIAQDQLYITSNKIQSLYVGFVVLPEIIAIFKEIERFEKSKKLEAKELWLPPIGRST